MESKDRLEEFIKAHKESFDDLKAPARAWERISPAPQQIHLWKWTAIAAGGLLLIAVGYIYGLNTRSHPQIAGWDEYQEAEQYYQVQIDRKIKDLQALPVGDEVLHDIEVLDEVYEHLRAQLLEDPNANTELLLSAMIRHQQQKLDVMEKILSHVDKYQKNENNNQDM